MTVQYLLDTNTASYVIKGNFPKVRQKLLRIPMTQVFISGVTEGELLYGVARKPQATTLQRLVEEFILRVTVLAWNSYAAREYGVLRADLERSGRSIGNLDLMIAAQALAADAVLVSSDHAFSRVKKLKVEDWTV